MEEVHDEKSDCVRGKNSTTERSFRTLGFVCVERSVFNKQYDCSFCLSTPWLVPLHLMSSELHLIEDVQPVTSTRRFLRDTLMLTNR